MMSRGSSMDEQLTWMCELCTTIDDEPARRGSNCWMIEKGSCWLDMSSLCVLNERRKQIGHCVFRIPIKSSHKELPSDSIQVFCCCLTFVPTSLLSFGFVCFLGKFSRSCRDLGYSCQRGENQRCAPSKYVPGM